MNKKQASEALANGHAITHNTCLPGGYYHPKSVKVVTEVDGKVKETEATQVFDELNQCLGKPETFFRMKGLQMHETGWSISTTKDFNPITKQSKKNGKAAK